MANIKISELPAASAAAAANQFEINESGTSKRVTAAQVLTYVQSNVQINLSQVTGAEDNDIAMAIALG